MTPRHLPARRSRPGHSILLLLVMLPAAAPAPVETRVPGEGTPGTVYEWTAANDLRCRYRLPAACDPEAGAGLTMILHGSNLDRRWGFANHSAESFRPDDIVVVPDGTTPNGSGGFNFLQSRQDLERLHELHEELRQLLHVRATYLYGHSQGSFFALLYAGAYPAEVQGVVAHASGAWRGTELGPPGHPQAIVLMHGTRDPVVPYGQSPATLEAYLEAGHPLVRLRPLEGWNHWPAEHNGPVPHTSRQLAWCEAMTTTDRQRQQACLEMLLDVTDPGAHDYAGAYALARHLREDEDAPEALRARAARAAKAIEVLAARHVAALELPRRLTFQGRPWIYHLPVFLRQFAGVPAREQLARKLARGLEPNRAAGAAALREFREALRKGKQDDAFRAGLEAITRGFLYHGCADRGFRQQMRELRAAARELQLSRKVVARYDAVAQELDDGLEDGWKAYEKVNARHGKEL